MSLPYDEYSMYLAHVQSLTVMRFCFHNFEGKASVVDVVVAVNAVVVVVVVVIIIIINKYKYVRDTRVYI
jgi:hypothetical protein